MMKQKSKADLVFDALPTIEEIAASDEYDIGTPGWIVRKMGNAPSNSVGRDLIRLHAQDRAHIHKYTEENKNAPRAMWVKGAGEHAKLPVMTPQERARRRSEITKLSLARSRERIANGETTMAPKLTQAAELSRSLETVARARTVPHRWFTPLADLQEAYA